MCAFAANSLLCRAALASGQADAASFTTLRIASGALALGLLARASGARAPAAWPASASGSSPASARTDSQAMVARLMATSATSEMTTATLAAISCTRIAMKSHAKVVNCWTNDGSDSGMPMLSAIARTATTTEARAQTPAVTPAIRVAVTRRLVRVVSGMRYAACTRSPTVAAAARSWTARV